MATRDDFSQTIKSSLAKRVGMRCSNPGCGQPTSGPQSDPEKTINIGVAAHICAASAGGRRFDPGMSSDERSSADNGIWLCQNCAKLIDSDEARYTPDLLRRWRQMAEAESCRAIEAPSGRRFRVDADGAEPARSPNACLAPVEARLIEGGLALPLFHPNTRSCSGQFVIANDAPRPLNITRIDLPKELPGVNRVNSQQRPQYGGRSPSDQNLPLYVRAGEKKRIFFITDDIPRPVQGRLPDNVRLDVTIDGRETIRELNAIVDLKMKAMQERLNECGFGERPWRAAHR